MGPIRVTEGRLDGASCYVVEVPRRSKSEGWDQDTAAMFNGEIRIEGPRAWPPDGRAAVIHGYGLAAGDHYGAAFACALRRVGIPVYVGEANDRRSGVARCVTAGNGPDNHVVGRRLWYDRGPREGTTAAEDRELRLQSAAARLWKRTDGHTRGMGHHQVLVSSRQSVIDEVLHELDTYIERAQKAGARMRWTLVDGPGSRKDLTGFWSQVLDAVGSDQLSGAKRLIELGAVGPSGETGEALAAKLAGLSLWQDSRDRAPATDAIQEMEGRALDAERAFWHGWSEPGKTVLVVNNFDDWCRHVAENGEAWSFHQHLCDRKDGFLLLGCAEEWPPPWCENLSIVNLFAVTRAESPHPEASSMKTMKAGTLKRPAVPTSRIGRRRRSTRSPSAPSARRRRTSCSSRSPARSSRSEVPDGTTSASSRRNRARSTSSATG